MPQQQQRQHPLRSNKTERNRTERGMLFLSTHSANRAPLRPPLSERQPAIRRRCSLCQYSLHYADVEEDVQKQEGKPQKGTSQSFKGCNMTQKKTTRANSSITPAICPIGTHLVVQLVLALAGGGKEEDTCRQTGCSLLHFKMRLFE